MPTFTIRLEPLARINPDACLDFGCEFFFIDQYSLFADTLKCSIHFVPYDSRGPKPRFRFAPRRVRIGACALGYHQAVKTREKDSIMRRSRKSLITIALFAVAAFASASSR